MFLLSAIIFGVSDTAPATAASKKSSAISLDPLHVSAINAPPFFFPSCEVAQNSSPNSALEKQLHAFLCILCLKKKRLSDNKKKEE